MVVVSTLGGVFFGVAPTAEMTSSAAPDNFMDMVGPMVASGDFTSLIDYCSLVELQMASAGAELAAGADVRMLLLAAQLVCGDLNAARFTWKRTPENIRSSSPELRALWEVGKCMWQQKPCVEAIAAFAWSPLIQQLLFLVQSKFTLFLICLIIYLCY